MHKEADVEPARARAGCRPSPVPIEIGGYEAADARDRWAFVIGTMAPDLRRSSR